MWGPIIQWALTLGFSLPQIYGWIKKNATGELDLPKLQRRVERAQAAGSREAARRIMLEETSRTAIRSEVGKRASSEPGLKASLAGMGFSPSNIEQVFADDGDDFGLGGGQAAPAPAQGPPPQAGAGPGADPTTLATLALPRESIATIGAHLAGLPSDAADPSLIDFLVRNAGVGG